MGREEGGERRKGEEPEDPQCLKCVDANDSVAEPSRTAAR